MPSDNNQPAQPAAASCNIVLGKHRAACVVISVATVLADVATNVVVVSPAKESYWSGTGQIMRCNSRDAPAECRAVLRTDDSHKSAPRQDCLFH